MFIETKIFQHESHAKWWDEPTPKGNFKRLSSRVHSKLHTWNLRFMTDETQNQLWNWFISSTHIFFIYNLYLIRNMFVLIWRESVWSSLRESPDADVASSERKSEDNGTCHVETPILDVPLGPGPRVLWQTVHTTTWVSPENYFFDRLMQAKEHPVYQTGPKRCMASWSTLLVAFSKRMIIFVLLHRTINISFQSK
jgi:hypothetical protein